MITIDWQFVGGVALLVFGGIGALVAMARRLPSFSVAPSTVDVPPDSAKAVVEDGDRSADAIAPPGAVEWVLDIVGAMSQAEPGTILESLKIGESRDQARTRRIAELETRTASKAGKKAGES